MAEALEALRFNGRAGTVLAECRGNPQEARGKLREAHGLYTEMGATGHAKRLARELAPS